MRIQRYTSSNKTQWNDFVQESVNGCFLHHRDFMEYHAYRFNDHSLMFFKNMQLVACFPAHSIDNQLKSHRGLTYGSFLLTSTSKDLFEDLVKATIKYASDQGFIRVELKLPPAYYNPYYDAQFTSLSNNAFKVVKNSVDLFVDLRKEWLPSSKKTAGYRNGKFDHLTLVESNDLAAFWRDILIPQLQERHDATPVHSIEEIELLKSRFPQQILHYYVEFEGEHIAGATLFNFDNVLKVQYAFGNQKGFDKKAMDFLYMEVIYKAHEFDTPFVDLGTVNNPDGSINEGLQRFKVELGAKTTLVKELTVDLPS